MSDGNRSDGDGWFMLGLMLGLWWFMDVKNDQACALDEDDENEENEDQ